MSKHPIDWEKVWKVFDAWIEKRTGAGSLVCEWSIHERKIQALVKLQTKTKIDWPSVWKANEKWFDRTCAEWDRQKKDISTRVNKQMRDKATR
jgi:hypothetical protein